MIVLATNNGVVIGDRADTWHILRSGLEGKQVTSVIAREGVILAGTTDGIFRSDDEGSSWVEGNAGLTHRHVRWLAYHPDISDFEFAGTEPADIFVSRDGAGSWREAAEVAKLRDQFHWFLPYSPKAGCVRGFAVQGSRAYAAVEVGGVLRSDDGGMRWRLAEGSSGIPDFQNTREPFVHPDIHSVYVHPSSPELVFAATGGGFYRSADGGKTWRCIYVCYCRAAWIDPSDAGHILFGPADNVDSQGRIEETQDGGNNWHMASEGLAVPWARHMVERFVQVGDELFAVLSNGELVAASVGVLQWERVMEEVKGVNAVSEFL
ncbi:MAG TPA: hypothetical protein VGJ97_02410 [Anaerolineaceae bacterium]